MTDIKKELDDYIKWCNDNNVEPKKYVNLKKYIASKRTSK